MYCTVLYTAGLQDTELDKGGKEIGEEAGPGNGVTKEAPGGGYSVNYKVRISCRNMVSVLMLWPGPPDPGAPHPAHPAPAARAVEGEAAPAPPRAEVIIM